MREVRFERDGEAVTGGKPGETWEAVYRVPQEAYADGMTEAQAEEHDQSPRFVKIRRAAELPMTEAVREALEEGGHTGYAVTREQPEYATLTAPDHGKPFDEIDFTPWLRSAHSGADWAATAGKWAVVVELPSRHVVYDTNEDVEGCSCGMADKGAPGHDA